ncbi:MAG: tyrosine-type recombinase/integrase [Spirochaetota bacterium]|nr:tyrosine-type recombinase/integrase [Spirochaetota bacterium]
MRTISANRKLLEEIIKLWGDRELSGITSAEVTAYFFQDEKHSNGVKNTYIQIFSEIYDEAEWQGLRIQKPAFKRFVRHSKKPDIFTTDELNRLFKPENFRDEMSYLFFLLCFSAGLRLGEALAVRPCQILHDRQALIVDGFLRYNHERTNYNKTGTAENNRFRVTMLPKYVLAKLADYIYRRNIQQEALIFTNSAGAPQSSGWAQYVFALALKKAGVDTARRKLCIHALRFTYVTRMRALLPVEIVQRAVGHMSADMTDYYTRPSLEASLKGVEGLEQASEKLFE